MSYVLSGWSNGSGRRGRRIAATLEGSSPAAYPIDGIHWAVLVVKCIAAVGVRAESLPVLSNSTSTMLFRRNNFFGEDSALSYKTIKTHPVLSKNSSVLVVALSSF